jgi:catechol 2,3-dioxygenase-like lactoylglutathione lyase family enzyme
VLDHLTIRASDRDASERFYETVLETLGIEKDYSSDYGVEWRDFSLSAATAEKPATRRLHIAFGAPSRAHVDEFWRVGTEAGYGDDGPPGERPQYSESYYGSFLLDPDGNSAEAVHHDAIRGEGWIDHVWMRVADVDASRRFYELVAPFGGFQLRRARPDRAQFVGAGGSFSVVVGDQPTENVHLAFPNGSNSGVEAFHRALVDAGYRSNGEPGERPSYHEGYYGAFVFDPDGNNVEVVNHNRG